jgi:hypothetical protein
MIVNQITNHVQIALDRLIQQYKGRPNLEGLLTAFVTQIQDLENAIYPIDQYRQLMFAYGQQLDNLGEIIGLKRNGLADNEYLVLLLGTIAENNSDTTAPVLLYIVKTVFQATNVFIKDPNSITNKNESLSAQVAFGVGSPQTGSSLYILAEQIIKNSVAAGVAITYLSKFNATNAFAMAGPQPWVQGFSSLAAPTIGGQFASLIQQVDVPFLGLEEGGHLLTEEGGGLQIN